MKDDTAGQPLSLEMSDVDKLKIALQNLKDNWEIQEQWMLMKAKLDKGLYEAYITEGFTPEQAMYLIKGKSNG